MFHAFEELLVSCLITLQFVRYNDAQCKLLLFEQLEEKLLGSSGILAALQQDV